MAIVVETGSGDNSAANSYVTEAELTTYATDHGITIAGTAATLLLNAMVSLDTSNFKGFKVSASQPLQWPRSGVIVDGFTVGSDEIPNDLKNAQIVTALAVDQGNDPSAVISQGVKSKSVDVISIEYKDGSVNRPFDPKINAYLSKLIVSGAGGFAVVRA
jgi:hypothetical protein